MACRDPRCDQCEPRMADPSDPKRVKVRGKCLSYQAMLPFSTLVERFIRRALLDFRFPHIWWRRHLAPV